MKKVILFSLVLMMGFVAACEAEEEPAATPFLLPPAEPDVTEDVTGGEDVSVPSDTVAEEDTASSGDTANVEDVEASEDAAAADTAEDAGSTEDVAAEDVSSEDIFVPGNDEGACKAGGNPGEAKFGDVDEQTATLRSVLTECFMGGVMEGEEFYSCMREGVSAAYGCTEDCSQCFAVRAECMKIFCWSGCIMSSSSDVDACAECQVENYCLHPFETCSGLPVF